MTTARLNTLSPAAFDEHLQAKYLQLISQGHSATSAARACHLSPATVRRHIRTNPDLADRERQAHAEAVGLVEDATFRAALGQFSPTEESYHEALARHHAEHNPDAPPLPPPKPPSPSLKAQELILTRLDRQRWGSDTAPTSTITVQALTSPEGLASFAAELQARRDAALPAPAPAAQPDPTDDGIYDAEVLP